MTATPRGPSVARPSSREQQLGGPANLVRAAIRQHGLFALGTALVALLVALWRATQAYPTALNDLYPLYFGARAWWQGFGAYNLTPVVPASHHPYPLYQIGNIYPLPAILIVLPLTLLTPTAAAMAWLATLVAGLLVALRLNGWGYWLLGYLPVINAIYAEQFTLLILVCQLLALWAYRTERPWILALCSALILAKPNQGFFFVLALVLLSRRWKEHLIVGVSFWGGSLLLDPRWVGEWLPTLWRHHELTRQPILWGLALLAVPLLLVRNPIGAAVMAQFLIMPYPLAAYPLSAVPLGVLGHRRFFWLIPLSFTWMLAHLAIGEVWASVLTLVLPAVALALSAASAGWWRNGWRGARIRPLAG